MGVESLWDWSGKAVEIFGTVAGRVSAWQSGFETPAIWV
jgi:hypothetical protein